MNALWKWYEISLQSGAPRSSGYGWKINNRRHIRILGATTLDPSPLHSWCLDFDSRERKQLNIKGNRLSKTIYYGVPLPLFIYPSNIPFRNIGWLVNVCCLSRAQYNRGPRLELPPEWARQNVRWMLDSCWIHSFSKKWIKLGGVFKSGIYWVFIKMRYTNPIAISVWKVVKYMKVL